MYFVVSRWEPVPGREEEFDRAGPEVGALLRSQPGVELVEVFKNGPIHVAVHAYKDEATYHALIDDPNGAFQQAVEARGMEQLAQWLGSERGESLPH